MILPYMILSIAKESPFPQLLRCIASIHDSQYLAFGFLVAMLYNGGGLSFFCKKCAVINSQSRSTVAHVTTSGICI